MARGRRGSATLEALASACILFVAFVAYGWSAPRPFLAHASISTPGAFPGELTASEAADRLTEALFDGETADARARKVGVDPALLSGSAAGVVRVDSRDGRTFELSCKDVSVARAAELCRSMARLAVDSLPVAFDRSTAANRAKLLSSSVSELARLAVVEPALTARASTPAPSESASSAWRTALEKVAAPSRLAPPATAQRGASSGEVTTAAISAPRALRTMAFGGVAALCVALVLGATGARRMKPSPAPYRAAELQIPESAARLPSERPPAPTASPTPNAPQAAEAPAAPARPAEARIPTILPPPSQSPPAADRLPSAPAPARTAAAPVVEDLAQPATEVSSSPNTPRLGSEPPAGSYLRIPVRRTTQMLGSLAPSAGSGSGSVPSDKPAPSRGDSTPPHSAGGGRYSFVSTPPPARLVPVRPYDVGPDWKPEAVDSATCRPLARELYSYGVDSCFTVGICCLRDLDEQRAELAASLALALAAPGHARVLLIDADFDQPRQHRIMRAEMPPGFGFSRQLQTRMMSHGDEAWTVLRCTKALHLLVDGVENQSGLILSRSFEACVRGLRAYYDFIVIDGPSGFREAECRALDGVADGLMIACTDARRSEVARTSLFFTPKRFSKAIRVPGGEV